jgi:hypothetical protein
VTVCDFGGELGGPVEPTPDDHRPGSILRSRQPSGLGSHLGSDDRRAHAPVGTGGRDAESFRRYSVGGESGSVRVYQFSINQLRDRMVATGRVTTHQIDACIARLRDPAVGHLSFETWYAWGRRPAKDSSESTDN